jgi:Transposase DDE domain
MTSREGLYKEILRLFVGVDMEVSDPILHHLTTFTTFLCEGTVAHLTRLSDALSNTNTKPEAKEQVVRRFLSSGKISSEQTLDSRIALALPIILRQKEIVITLDRTEWKKRKQKVQILSASAAMLGRAVPLHWTTANRKGNTSFEAWQALLRPVIEALMRFEELATYRIVVVADREFASPRLVHWLLENFGVYAVVRCKRSQYMQEEDSPSKQLSAVISGMKPGETQFFPSVLLTKAATKPIAVCISWRSDCEEPLIAGTSLDNAEDTVARYKQRFGTEPMYKDLKSNGFDLESTKVTDAKRIDTLMILCAFAMIIVLTLGIDREESQQSRTTVKSSKKKMPQNLSNG